MEYPVRIRDLLHSFVYLTEDELSIIDQPIFQRLRHITQNDVASRVYPSLNTSRFEHSLGTAFVAGKMAQSILNNITPRLKTDYFKGLGLNTSDSDEFIQTVRAYALLHDVGHFPLSHLFEAGFADYVVSTYELDEGGEKPKEMEEVCAEWFGVDGFAEIHEAFAAIIVDNILRSSSLSEKVKDNVSVLIKEKDIPDGKAVSTIKKLVDSEIDADRIDSTARDGLLAGGEYGNYDIDRICSSVSVFKEGEEWRLGFSEKVMSSLEALLFERYRTHTWVHFHHRAIVLKAAARIIIKELLSKGIIGKKTFSFTGLDELVFLDDVWLWQKIRDYNPETICGDTAKSVLTKRQKAQVTLLWRRRADYTEWNSKLIERALKGRRQKKWGDIGEIILTRDYAEALYDHFKQEDDSLNVRSHFVKFKALSPEELYVLKNGRPLGDICEYSPLLNNLERIRDEEPKYYVIAFGPLPEGYSEEKLREEWLGFTVNYVKSNLG